MFDRLVKFFASPPFALTCMFVGAGLIGLALFPLQFFGIPGDQTARLATRGLPFVAVYLLIVLSAIACFRKRITALPKLVEATPRLPSRETEVVSDRPFTPKEAAMALRRAGFRHVVAETDRVFGVRAAYAPFGNLLLHVAILLVVIAAGVSQIPGASFVGRARVAEGELFKGGRANFAETADKPGVLSRSGREFAVEKVEGTSVGQRPATLAVTVRGASGRPRRITAGWPWIPDPVTMIAVEDFGLSNRISIIASGAAEPLATSTLDLTAHGSDSTEYYVVGAASKRFRVGIRAQTRPASADAETPLMVSLGEADAASGGWKQLAALSPLRVGETLRAGAFRIRLDDTRPHAVLRIHRSSYALLALLGLLCAAVGSFMRLATPRTEAIVERREDGRTALKAACDVYRTASRTHARLLRAWEDGS